LKGTGGAMPGDFAPASSHGWRCKKSRVLEPLTASWVLVLKNLLVMAAVARVRGRQIMPEKTLYLWRGSARSWMSLAQMSDMSIPINLRYHQVQDKRFFCGAGVRKKIAFWQGELPESQTCLQLQPSLPCTMWRSRSFDFKPRIL
jgi:hypothetical protein